MDFITTYLRPTPPSTFFSAVFLTMVALSLRQAFSKLSKHYKIFILPTVTSTTSVNLTYGMNPS